MNVLILFFDYSKHKVYVSFQIYRGVFLALSASQFANNVAVSMPRAEAGTRAGLPSFERWSFDLAPFTNCLQNWELDNFLVFHLFLVAVLSGLHLFLCLFTYVWCSFPLRADWPKLTAQSTGSHRGTRGRIQITEMWLQALLPFSPCRQSAPGELAHKQWRSENSPFIMQNSWVKVW